jgi:hypothetical protein
MWMTPSEELKQGVKGLALHFCEAYAVVLTAYVLGTVIDKFPHWGWFATGMAVVGPVWEVGSHLWTRYRTANHPVWKKSFLGMAAFWVGVIIAGVLITIVGYYLGTP